MYFIFYQQFAGLSAITSTLKKFFYPNLIVMPGDTLHANSKATQQNTYDAIVVGSGISGGWAAKELTEKGLRVLMLERGRPHEAAPVKTHRQTK